MIRPFSWSDVPAFTRIAAEDAAAGGARPPFTERSAKEYLGQPNLAPERDCFLAEIGGSVAGYVLMVPELSIGRVVLETAASPAFEEQGVWASLLAWGTAHARRMGARLAHVPAHALTEPRRRALRIAGFLEVKRQWRMRLSPPDFPRREAPTAPGIRAMTPGQEPLVTDIQNRAFEGSWGFAPNFPREVAYRIRMGGGGPQDVLLMLEGGSPVAYCWTRATRGPEAPAGVIWMIGVAPEARGRGLGRVMLEAGLQHLQARGCTAVELMVYQDNTPAVELYRAMGFKPVAEVIWYELPLRTVKPPG